MRTTPDKRPAATSPQRPWWREGMVWLVISGPAVVVVAGITTAVIAYRGADEVLQVPPEVRTVNPRPDAQTPAMQARNHAATAAPASR
jgi:uncharacterized protein